MKLLLVDNYDSFTFNLAHYLEELGAKPTVVRNDAITAEELGNYSHIVISPGPGLPENAGSILEIIKNNYQQKSILGICLGAQAIAQVFEGELYNQNEVAHGIQREVEQEQEGWLLKGVPATFKAGLYHSWAIRPKEKMTAEFQLLAYRDKQVLMAFEHPIYPLAGLQFHPESIMTEYGKVMLKNWLER
jgi:anthranilate synthase/aminodeoxychorismate synthase-like glutamine amidotransferase